MKKLLSLLIVCGFATIMVSCKKDRTCKCTTTYNGSSNTSEVTVNGTKKKAKEACEKYNVTAGASRTSCELK